MLNRGGKTLEKRWELEIAGTRDPEGNMRELCVLGKEGPVKGKRNQKSKNKKNKK